MSVKPVINISVRNLVDYVMQEGDISFRFFKQSRLIEGTKAHQKVQKSKGKGYQKEVHIAETFKRKNCILNIRGRIDGLYKKDETIIIEEIKSTAEKLEWITKNSFPKYWAQAKFYACLYSNQNNLERITVQLTYYQIETKRTRSFEQQYSLKELEVFCFQIIDQYLEWASTLAKWLKLREESIKQFKFPFPSFREGQENLIRIVSEIISKQSKLYCQAPTGIGKTIATLFPAVKSLGDDYDSKIFYLTAKTTTRFIAEETIELMRKAGLKIKSITITAKAKICFKEQVSCDPSFCEFAKGYFDRVNDAIKDIYKKDAFTQKVIEKYAMKHKVCPFEFSLELSKWSDCVICDYNYAFDPRVFLRRFFVEEKGDFVFLIDESHNLVDRAREMFSADLSKKPILALRRKTRDEIPELSKVLNKLNQFMIKYRKLCEEDNTFYHIQADPPENDFLSTLRVFCRKAENWLELNRSSDFNEELLELYFNVRNFIRVTEDYDERFITYFRKFRGNVILKLFCIDPSFLLKEALNRGKSAVFFSATLTPLEYFASLLGGDNSVSKLQLPSPFPEENLCLLVQDNISTRYKDRPFSYDKIASLIQDVVKGKLGNYLIFFPSYEYMAEVLEEFQKLNTDANLIVQESNMGEKERENFLKNFSNFGKTTLVGFVVMGGIFSEGIDLVGEKLSGAVVVGVGLPKISLERDLIKGYFDSVNGKGFLFAYTFPGMNKVFQSAGRVIRTERDRGVVLLIGERYTTRTYSNLFPSSWNTISRISSKENMLYKIKKFWNEEMIV